jgi:hypothetical protein
MNPVNGFSTEGLPTLYLSNMPVQSTVPGLKVTRPEIYFGEMTDTDVYVKTASRNSITRRARTTVIRPTKAPAALRWAAFCAACCWPSIAAT